MLKSKVEIQGLEWGNRVITEARGPEARHDLDIRDTGEGGSLFHGGGARCSWAIVSCGKYVVMSSWLWLSER